MKNYRDLEVFKTAYRLALETHGMTMTLFL